MAFLMLSPLLAQLEVEGEIRGDYSRLRGADMIYLLPPLDPLEMEAQSLTMQGPSHKSRRFAMLRDVELDPLFHGVWEEDAHGRTWRIHLISPGAHSLGLLFDRFHMEEGVRMMVYSPDRKHVKGAYSANNNKASGAFAIGHLPGDELILELQVPSGMDHFGQVLLSSISHGLFDNCPGSYGCSQDCEIDINCSEGSDWQLEKRAVVRVNTPTQYCSGVLINNTAYDGAPLLLTAKHCIESSYTAEQTVYEFGYESPSCNGGDGNLNRSISGSELLAVGDSVDFCLVRLSVDPPASFEPYYAGWDLADSQSGGTTSIHHPQGDVKKISADLQAPVTPAGIGEIAFEFRKYYYYSFWRVNEWDSGTTEQGSSGAPLFNQDSQVIGVLSWGYADCIDPTRDFYSKMGVAWDAEEAHEQSLYHWLDPIKSGVQELGSYEPLSVPPEPSLARTHFLPYPNPASERIYLAGLASHPEALHYALHDLQGKCLLEGVLEAGASEGIPVAGLPGGLYLLGLQHEGGRESHKIRIQ